MAHAPTGRWAARTALPAALIAALALCALVLPGPASGATAHSAVVKGTPVEASSYPYAGFLTTGEDAFSDYGAFCTVVLVRPTVALTAAHCVLASTRRRPLVTPPLHKLHVVFGKTRLSDTASAGERIDVTQVSVPNAFLPTPRGDVAVLRLARPASVQPAVLPGAAQARLAARGTPVSFVGWGEHKPNVNPGARVLRLGQAKVERCRLPRELRRIGEPSFLCEGSSRQRFCFGDSGGPGLAPGASPLKPFVIGVVSTGGGCGIRGTGVFTSLLPQSPFSAWVGRNVDAPPDLAPPVLQVSSKRVRLGAIASISASEPVRAVCRLGGGPRIFCFKGIKATFRIAKARFPHARVLSVTAYDESFNAASTRIPLHNG